MAISEPEFKGYEYEDTLQPEGLLGKLFESKSDKIKRLEAAAAQMKQKEDQALKLERKFNKRKKRRKGNELSSGSGEKTLSN